eukprot:gene6719-22395_t
MAQEHTACTPWYQSASNVPGIFTDPDAMACHISRALLQEKSTGSASAEMAAPGGLDALAACSESPLFGGEAFAGSARRAARRRHNRRAARIPPRRPAAARARARNNEQPERGACG